MARSSLRIMGIVALLMAFLVTSLAESDPIVFTIGALLDDAESLTAMTFAVDYVNEVVGTGNGSWSIGFKAYTATTIASFQNAQFACDLMATGVVALVGPMSSTGTRAVAPLAGALRVPIIAPVSTDPQLGHTGVYHSLVRMMAPDSVQSRALVSLVEHYGWSRMAILTSNTDYGQNGLVEFQAQAAHRDWRIICVLRFSVSSGSPDVDAREQLRFIMDTGVRVVLLHCEGDLGRSVLRQAGSLGMTSPGWGWLVTDGITGTNLQARKARGLAAVPDYLQGMLGTRPANSRGALWEDMMSRWRLHGLLSAPTAYQTYLMDSVLTIGYALNSLSASGNLSDMSYVSLDCQQDPSVAWQAGDLLLKHIKMVDADGISSRIHFFEDGTPQTPSFDIVNLKADGWMLSGSWNSAQGLEWQARSKVTLSGNRATIADYVSSLANKTIVIVVLEEAPFVIAKNRNLDANDVKTGDLEGFCIDVLEKLAATIGFRYKMYFVKDKAFGAKDPYTKQWNGLVKDLIDRKADIAVADLTINHARETDIDFTKPFIDLGMTFVMKVPDKEPWRPFKFLDPFSMKVWAFILLTTLCVGLVISILNKISPYDHHGEFVYIDSERTRESAVKNYKEYKLHRKMKLQAMREMNYGNAVWFSIASVLQQGGETYPLSFSARLLAVLWWFGIMIILSTYTANLAAFLTSSRSVTPIDSVEDLGAQTKVWYGTLQSSAPYQYFMDSEMTLFKDMASFMNTRKTFLTSTTEAITKTREEDFAFIWDSAVLDFLVEQKPCNTIQTVGRLFGKIGYGFGLQKNSPHKDELSMHILQLRESGFMDDLKKKWYQERGECHRQKVHNTEQSEQIQRAGGTLGVEHMLGIFFIVFGGLVLSFFVLIIEWIVKCASVVDKIDPLAASSFREAVGRRWSKLCHDVRGGWFPGPPYCCTSPADPGPELSDMEKSAHTCLTHNTTTDNGTREANGYKLESAGHDTKDNVGAKVANTKTTSMRQKSNSKSAQKPQSGNAHSGLNTPWTALSRGAAAGYVNNGVRDLHRQNSDYSTSGSQGSPDFNHQASHLARITTQESIIQPEDINLTTIKTPARPITATNATMDDNSAIRQLKIPMPRHSSSLTFSRHDMCLPFVDRRSTRTRASFTGAPARASQSHRRSSDDKFASNDSSRNWNGRACLEKVGDGIVESAGREQRKEDVITSADCSQDNSLIKPPDAVFSVAPGEETMRSSQNSINEVNIFSTNL